MDEKLTSMIGLLVEGQSRLEGVQNQLVEGQTRLVKGQKEMKKKLDKVVEEIVQLNKIKNAISFYNL